MSTKTSPVRPIKFFFFSSVQIKHAHFTSSKDCEFHYYKLFGKICPRCQKVVTGEGVHAIGQLFHPECFLCSGCNKQLKGNVYDYESKPLCKSCFSKLPKVIRDAIEKKLEAEKKMQKEKEKAEKEAARARAAGKT